MLIILGQITLEDLEFGVIGIVVLIIILIILVLLFSIYKFRVVQNRKKWNEIIQYKITDAIVEGIQTGTTEGDQSFQNYLKNSNFRNLFLSVLTTSNRRFAGTAQNEMFGLFYSFGLENDAWKKIKKKKPYLISGGIQELTSMKVDNVIPELLKLLNHPEKHVYQEAQYCLVNFQGFDGLFFLDNLKSPLSDWQQIRLLQSIPNVSNSIDNKVLSWLKSGNKTVVIFALRLISNFQLLAYYDYIVDLLYDSSTAVRKQAVITLQSIENRDTNSLLIESFNKQPKEVQKEIMSVLKVSKSKETKQFLIEQLNLETTDNKIRILAAEILLLLNEESYLRELLTNSDTSPTLLSIVKHALQEKI